MKMKSKAKWHSFLFIGLVLLLSSLVVACKPSPPPVIVDFRAAPTQINAGESAILLWNVTQATTVSIDHGIGNVLAIGTKEVSPAITTAYTLTATNASGTITKPVVVTVGAVSPPPTQPAPASPPTIAFSPSSLSFSAEEGGANPSSQTLNIWNSGGGTLDWTVTADANWVSLSPTSGSSDGETDRITVLADTYGMDAGNYASIITISAPGASNTPQTIAVNLAITSVHRQVLFSDDFSDESSAWDTYSDTEGSAFYHDGALHLKANTFAEYAVVSYHRQEFTDFALEVETKLVEGTDDNWHQVFCRIQNTIVPEYYEYAISADGYYRLGKVVNEEPIELVPTTRSIHIHTGENAVNLMRIECVGSNLRLSVNGHLLAETEDSTYASGSLGLAATGWMEQHGKTFTEIAFDNLVVTTP